MYFVWIKEQTAILSLHSINLPVFITEAESVYCAVRTGSLNQTNTFFFHRFTVHFDSAHVSTQYALQAH
jgi:hypothetical protein